ncbi:MAG: Multisubunit sodium/proton antiporter, MrpD subunit [Methanosarcinales archeaon 56_1174]|nr:MAG: Multisubunit sodium/proton antiporter, MrpD subunit [Methanosarcinales archeaon 56_1174]
MEAITSATPALAVLVSLVAAALILLTGRHPNLRESVSVGASLIKFAIVASMMPTVLAGTLIEFKVVDILPNLPIMFRVDAFGMVFGLTASFLWILTTLYSMGYMRSLEEHSQTRYYFCFAIALSSAMGIAFAANLVTLFIFYELLTVSTYPLVVHSETPEAMSAGRKYLLYLLTAEVFLLFSTIAVYFYTGTTDFAFGGILEGHDIPVNIIRLLFITFMIGCTKAAFMPLHSWLPTAMIAPTPVSALLHAVAVVKAGVFTAVRIILYIFGVNLMQETGLALAMAYFVSFTIITASIFALTQDNLKMRLAYSTVSQLSYIVLGVCMLTPAGIVGGMYHIVNHALMKITLFFCAGAIFVATGKKNISDMGGVGKFMPITMLAFFIASMGMIGIPPSIGFLSKWFISLGAMEAHQAFFAFVMVASGILNAAYFLPIVYTAFFNKPKEGEQFTEAPMIMVVPLLITALLTLTLGIAPQGVYTLLLHALQQVMP